MKVFLLILLIHAFAYSVSKAEEPKPLKTAATIDDCKDLLPQVESDYRELEAKYQSLRQNLPYLQENYLVSFNEMTETLFRMTEAREQETQNISAGRDQLRLALQNFNSQKSDETSAKLQESYLNLTIQLYTSMMESQKTLNSLKAEVSKVESTRSQYANSKSELDSLDEQKLAIEAKLVNLKIKCPARKY